MSINYEQLLTRQFAEITHRYDWRDSIIYALGLGIGTDPLNADELRFVYEDGLHTLPTMAVTLGHPGFWVAEPETGIDYRRVVHGEQSLIVHAQLPPEGTFVARNKVEEIIDKGEGRGMILRVRRDLFDEASGALQSSQVMSIFCRSDGGFGGPQGAPVRVITLPERAPDHSIVRFIPPQAALIYRLSGDLNPLHADPVHARASGFERPILHGLATFGVAGFALISAASGVGTLREISCRFSAPVFPGETLRIDIWDEGTEKRFRCTVVERNQVVLNAGQAFFA